MKTEPIFHPRVWNWELLNLDRNPEYWEAVCRSGAFKGVRNILIQWSRARKVHERNDWSDWELVFLTLGYQAALRSGSSGVTQEIESWMKREVPNVPIQLWNALIVFHAREFCQDKGPIASDRIPDFKDSGWSSLNASVWNEGGAGETLDWEWIEHLIQSGNIHVLEAKIKQNPNKKWRIGLWTGWPREVSRLGLANDLIEQLSRNNESYSKEYQRMIHQEGPRLLRQRLKWEAIGLFKEELAFKIHVLDRSLAQIDENIQKCLKVGGFSVKSGWLKKLGSAALEWMVNLDSFEQVLIRYPRVLIKILMEESAKSPFVDKILDVLHQKGHEKVLLHAMVEHSESMMKFDSYQWVQGMMNGVHHPRLELVFQEKMKECSREQQFRLKWNWIFKNQIEETRFKASVWRLNEQSWMTMKKEDLKDWMEAWEIIEAHLKRMDREPLLQKEWTSKLLNDLIQSLGESRREECRKSVEAWVMVESLNLNMNEDDLEDQGLRWKWFLARLTKVDSLGEFQKEWKWLDRVQDAKENFPLIQVEYSRENQQIEEGIGRYNIQGQEERRWINTMMNSVSYDLALNRKSKKEFEAKDEDQSCKSEAGAKVRNQRRL